MVTLTNSPSKKILSNIETTGRFLVLLENGGSEKKAMNRLKKASLNVASTSDFETSSISSADAGKDSDGLFYKELGVAILNHQPHTNQITSLQSSTDDSEGVVIEPERVVYTSQILDQAYMQGYFDAVKGLYDKVMEEQNVIQPSNLLTAADTTWGLQVTNTINSRFTGRGVNVAILDTGFYLAHPDFGGRTISTSSFIPNEQIDDLNGHGTHCTGTALGSRSSQLGPRYGVATDSNVFSGKVLSNAGRGTDGSILDGIEWAIKNKCKIISMSLGGPSDGLPYSQIFERAARRALHKGTLIIAAAGNDSRRRANIIRNVSHPANCPSIMAVAAIDNRLQVADFSNRGQVDLCGPGVNIYSSWISPDNVNEISGTSMATPHVAGIASLYAEAYPDISAYELWQFLITNARKLNLPNTDVGSGLVQAV